MKSKKTFEEAIVRLEEIVNSLEGGEAPLDESLELFEEAVALVNTCNKKLNEAEQKIKVLTMDENGEMTEKEME